MERLENSLKYQWASVAVLSFLPSTFWETLTSNQSIFALHYFSIEMIVIQIICSIHKYTLTELRVWVDLFETKLGITSY